MVLTDFLRAPRHSGVVLHTFDLPPKRRDAEGWAIVGIVALMIALLWLAL